jgi:hypothetical protein
MSANTRFQVILPIGYVALFLVSLIEVCTYPSHDPRSGEYAFLLTLPWCLSVAIFRLNRNQTTLVAALIVCAALNACCLYVLGMLIDYAVKRRWIRRKGE